jgi:hypothetical protein
LFQNFFLSLLYFYVGSIISQGGIAAPNPGRTVSKATTGQVGPAIALTNSVPNDITFKSFLFFRCHYV